MVRLMFCVVTLTIALGTAAPLMAQDVKAAGEKVFTEQKCSLCHSIAGKGNAKGVLDEVGTKLKPEEIRAWITDAKAMTEKTHAERKPPMKAYELSKADVDTLVAYLTTLKKK
jgi:mono/diheme cytochrome c family protein